MAKENPYYSEPDLGALLSDPLTHLLMEKDGVSEEDLNEIIEDFRDSHH